MRARLLAGIVAIGILGAVSLAVVLRDPVPGSAASPREGTSPPAPSGSRPASPPGRAPVAGEGEARPESLADAPPSAPGPGGPVPAARLSPPRAPRGSPAPVAFLAGLRDLEAGVRGCDDGTVRAGGGRATRTVFLLAFETQGGVTRIVDVLVQARGAASDAVVQCARERLLGREVAASAAVDGHQFEAPLAPWR